MPLYEMTGESLSPTSYQVALREKTNERVLIEAIKALSCNGREIAFEPAIKGATSIF